MKEYQKAGRPAGENAAVSLPARLACYFLRCMCVLFLLPSVLRMERTHTSPFRPRRLCSSSAANVSNAHARLKKTEGDVTEPPERRTARSQRRCLQSRRRISFSRRDSARLR
ncbi:hypothetical protein MRX96_005591 [Rhipicephalus microplus]